MVVSYTQRHRHPGNRGPKSNRLLKPSKESGDDFPTVSPFAHDFDTIAVSAPLMSYSPWDTVNFASHGVHADPFFQSVSPWDPEFPPAEFVAVSPWSEDFPPFTSAEYVWNNRVGMVRSNPRKCHHPVGRHGKGKNRRNIKIKKLILNFKKNLRYY